MKLDVEEEVESEVDAEIESSGSGVVTSVFPDPSMKLNALSYKLLHVESGHKGDVVDTIWKSGQTTKH